MATRTVAPQDLITLGTGILAAVGVPAADARLLADSLVTAELWGHSSHGMLRLPWYTARLRSGAMESIWTADTDRAVRLARSISSGAVFVNAVVATDPRPAFGGTKRSGHGRELAAAGIREFTTIRTYWITNPAGAPEPARQD